MRWCDKANPRQNPEDCGHFQVTLVQKGDSICGDYYGATLNLSKVDEGGGIWGVAVDHTAVLTLRSAREDSAFGLGRVQLRQDNQLDWELIRDITPDFQDAVTAEKGVLTPGPRDVKGPPRNCAHE
jgi:hypothetical protein